MTLNLSTSTSASHHLCTFSFPLLCSRPTPSPLLSFFISLSAFHSVLHRTFELTRALLFCHERKLLRSLYVTWSVELFVESMWRFLQCRDEAVVAVLMKPVKLFELYLSSVLHREVVKYISMVATRWCCVNKLQAVTPTGEAVLRVWQCGTSNFLLTSDKLSCQKYPHYVFIGLSCLCFT